jgi:uncharacterized membrane protein YukC
MFKQKSLTKYEKLLEAIAIQELRSIILEFASMKAKDLRNLILVSRKFYDFFKSPLEEKKGE